MRSIITSEANKGFQFTSIKQQIKALLKSALCVTTNVDNKQTPSTNPVAERLEQSLNEMKAHEDGKIKLKTARALLSEL